jgi:hypothetical protein
MDFEAPESRKDVDAAEGLQQRCPGGDDGEIKMLCSVESAEKVL